MVGTRRHATRSSARQAQQSAAQDASSIYDEMLVDAGVDRRRAGESSERPAKRLKPGSKKTIEPVIEKVIPPTTKQHDASLRQAEAAAEEEEDEDEDIEFEDVIIPAPNIQTMEKDSDDDSDGSDEDNDAIEFEDVVLRGSTDQPEPQDEPRQLELNLTAQKAASSPSKKAIERRKPITKEERELRTDIHKMHLLCLLSHVASRNHWCNDPKVHEKLRPHLTDKTITYLTPESHLPQFGQAESLKNGLTRTAEMWRLKFEISERGMRRALWAEDAEQLQNYSFSDDIDSCMDREDFRDAAARLQGSRDVGAQLYCALLRSVGVQARLVCSLQPLAFGSGAPTLPKPPVKKISSKTVRNQAILAQLAKQRQAAEESGQAGSSSSSARRRLGHPNAASYNFEPKPSPSPVQKTYEGPRQIKESLYPIYWVEVLDTGHQKWQPADPVVTHTFWKSRVLEPPITDKENSLSYVVAFDSDGSARDVTLRYAKAYSAKTRKLRVDASLHSSSSSSDSQWWRKVMGLYRKRWPTDLDAIEANELAGIEMREPMPRNVQDFKDHPVFALERHLRRHEVLVLNATPSGTISSGTRGRLEKIYRRRDVKLARTVDKWFRLGREVKPNEIPAKWLPKKVKPKSRFDNDFRDDDDVEDVGGGVPVYTEDQTELYEPAPVRNGRISKNKFGNIEVYVPSMIPKGGVHIIHEQAARAAFLARVDYAPVLTGFQFKGRQGTAVLNGVVVAEEYEAAVRAIIDGLGDLEQQLEDERKTLATLKRWRRLLMGLRIRERIWSGVDADEREAADKEAEAQATVDTEMDNIASDVTEEFDMADDDSDAGGGFMID